MKKEGFHAMNVDPNMILQIRAEWHSFEDYLGAFSSKYRVRIKKILKTGADMHLKELSAAEVREQAERIDVLYNAVQNKSKCQINYIIS